MCSYADDREQTSILITFSTVSIGTTGISRSREMLTRPNRNAVEEVSHEDALHLLR